MTQHQLDKLIEKYFAGDTTLEEERQLRIEMANTEENTPAINEARAVMSYSIADRPAAHRRTHVMVRLRVAASVAVLVVAGWVGYRVSEQQSAGAQCYAMINGEKITDDETVMEMMFAGLSDIAAAESETINETIDLLSSINTCIDEL